MFLSYENVLSKCSSCIITPYGKSVYSMDSDFILVVDEHGIFRQVLHILTKHPKKYDLIYYQTDSDFTPQYFECVKPYVRHIYAEGCRITHPMITKVPVISTDFKKLKGLRNIDNKEILCYLPKLGLFDDGNLHHLPGRVLREQCIKYFENKDFVTKEHSRIPHDEYSKKVSRSKFIICPMGVGVDTPKIYEAVYLGTTPIVIRNGLEDLYKKFGVLVVDDWDQVTPELLESHVHYQPPDELFELEYWIPPLA